MQGLRRHALAMLAALVSLPMGEAAAAQVVLASNSGPQAGRSLLEQPAHLEVRDVSLTVALARLATQSGVPLGFSPSMLRSDARTVACACAALRRAPGG